MDNPLSLVPDHTTPILTEGNARSLATLASVLGLPLSAYALYLSYQRTAIQKQKALM